MDNKGWISLHRGIANKGWFHKSDYVHLWIYLLLKANHKETEIWFNGKTQKMKIGSFITGRKKISRETGINQSKVERILKTFEIEQQIEQLTSNKNRVITVLNYNKYQKSEQQIEQQVNNNRTTSEQQVNTDNNVNNNNNENNNNKKPKVKKFLFQDGLKKLGADDNLIQDWISVRKVKKSVNTETAFNGFKKQLEISGKNINQVLEICINKSWGGFNASWLKDKKQTNNKKITF